MDSNNKKIGLLNWALLLAAALALALIGRYVGSGACVMAAALAFFGLLTGLLSYFQMGMEEREHFERLEIEELSKSRGGQSLFTTAGDDTFPAKRSREQFEKIVTPAVTGLLLALQVAAVWWPWMRLGSVGPIVPDRTNLAMALLALLGLILFLFGKYSSGLAKLRGQRLLRPGSAYLLLTAYGCFAAIAAVALTLTELPKADLLIGKAMCVVTGLIAIETLLGLILEVYRVRVRGREARLLYDSRLVGLLGQPEAIFTTAAHALDYQFGFKVSDTWFYQMLERALGWIILAQFVVLVLSTCFVVIDPGDQALLERFGKPVGDGVIGPGLHLKMPWPIDVARPMHTQRIQSFIVGAEPETTDVIQWTIAHAQEQNFLVASRALRSSVESTNSASTNTPPVALLSLSIPVQYQITNLAAWAYINEDPTNLLAGLAQREVMHYLASADFDELLSSGRQKAGEALLRNIQSSADARNLGARILFVGLQDIHPPKDVAKIYEQVVGAGQERAAAVLQAVADAYTTNGGSLAESNRVVSLAESDRHRAITNATARAELFRDQMMAYAATPGTHGIYAERAYLEALVKNSAKARKYIVPDTNKSSILMINLEDKVDQSVIDSLRPPSEKR